jgi:hypothetical protein
VPIVVAGLVATAVPAAAEPISLPQIHPDLTEKLAQQPVEYVDGRYIVELAADPVATYDGSTAGLSATATDDADGIDFDSDEVAAYRDFLDAERTDVLDDLGVDAAAEYDVVFAGFAADLTAAQAEKMAAHDKVAAVYEDELLHIDTATTPDFLGLSGTGGGWNSNFGSPEKAGEGVIVGIVDTGVWPENPSLGALPEPRPDQAVIDAKWSGECDEGEDLPEFNVTCNNKLIGARYFDTWGYAEVGFASPREEMNHGTHVMTTAAGNYMVDAQVSGESIGAVSGMAPAARVAAYKVCWAATGGCPTADSVAAIEAAVVDGVDVINFSISGSQTSLVSPVALAYFNAAAAGVFVSVSAGNSGPGSTVAHNYPWVTTVAASTHDMTYRSELTAGGATYTAAGLVGAAEYDLALAADVAYDDAAPAAAVTCSPGTLDPAKAAGYAIVCQRGNLFTDTANEVARAGGVAVIVRDQSERGPANVVTTQKVPVFHVDYQDGLALVDYVSSTEGPTASVTTSVREPQTAPSMAAFSSAGPALAAGGALLKPDITAPGVEIVAGQPTFVNGDDHGSLQGTSMSSPHVAGLGALLKSANPDWSPMAVKSAMMTTAYQTDNAGNPIQRGGADATPFDFGAGHVDGGSMFNPGLVYESDGIDWLQYLCGIGQAQLVPELAGFCDAYGPIDPWQLNYPSIAVANLTGKQTVTRTVTNVDNKMGVYFPVVEAPPGTKVTVNKRVMTVKPGKTDSYTITVERTSAAFDEWTWGSITWKDVRGHEVRSPIVVQPREIAVPAEVTLSGTSGSATLNGTAGFTGTLSTGASGLVASETETATLTDPDGSTFPSENPVERPQTVSYEFTTPASASLVRFATFDADHPVGTDLDLFVYLKNADGSLTLVGASAAGTSDEVVNLPGGYTFVVFVDLWGGPSSVDAVLHSWIVDGAAGNFSVSPATRQVTTGGSFTTDLSWSGLASGQRYLGTVGFRNNGSDAAVTVVNVLT